MARLGLNHEFAKGTRLANRFLEKFHLRICKDCQTICNADKLRCSDCNRQHMEYLREKIECDIRDDYLAEQELRNDID